MKGLKIKVHGYRFEIAVPDGECGVTMKFCRGTGTISVSGASKDLYKWYEAGLKDGDDISIEFTDIQFPDLPETIVRDFGAAGGDTYEVVARYNALKKELIEKGVLDENCDSPK